MKRYIKRFIQAGMVLATGIAVQIGFHWMGFDQLTASVLAIMAFAGWAWFRCKSCIRTRAEDLMLFAAGSLHILFAAFPGMVAIIMALTIFNYASRPAKP